MNLDEKKFKEITGIEFRDFYRIQRPKLVWHLAQWTLNLQEAEDLAEDSFIQALNKIETYNYEKGAQIHTWLYTIAMNIAKREHKKKQRIPTVSADKEIDQNTSLLSFLPYDDGRKDYEKERILSTKADIIKNAIHSLPAKQEKYKKVLVLRELENFTYDEISEYLNLNLSTVKSQIKKGREIIQKKVVLKLKHIDEYGLE